MTPISKRQHARFHIYTKQFCFETFIYCETFKYVYKNFKNQDNLRYVLFTKILTVYVTLFFNKLFELAFLYLQKA